MKKVFTILWVVVCCIGLFSCSNTNPTKAEPPISASTYYRDVILNEQSREWYDKIKQNIGADEIQIMNFNGTIGLDNTVPAQ